MYFHVLVLYVYIRRTLCESKQGCGVVSCTTFIIVTGVRADPKHSYSHMISLKNVYVYEDCYFWFSFKCFIFFGRYLVVGTVVGIFFFSVSMTSGATHTGQILFDTKQQRENSRVWPFGVRVMLLLDRSRAWMILTATQLWIAFAHMWWYGLGRPVITSEIGNWSVFV